MHVLLGLFLIWAFMHAAERGAAAGGRAIGRSVKAKYRARVTAYRAAHPNRRFGVSRRLGSGMASLAGHGGYAAAEFGRAWKQTWRDDRRRYDEWLQRRGTAAPEPQPSTPDEATSPPTPAPVPEPTPAPQPQPGNRPAPTAPPGTDTERRLRLVAPGADPDRTPSIQDRKEPDMAIDTATGGEVTTMEQLLAELRAIATEASAQMEDARNDEARAVDEIEDAAADARRAHEDAKRVELMVASLTVLDLDKQSLDEVGALADAAAAMKAAADERGEAAVARRSAAGKRAEAAEARHAQATAALSGVQQRHGLLAEAHAATPHAADKDFYSG